MRERSDYKGKKTSAYIYNVFVEHSTKGYCAICDETQSGRGGNDLASALRVLLDKVVEDHTDANNLIVWSDSCVPQNRNSLISYMLQPFLQT